MRRQFIAAIAALAIGLSAYAQFDSRTRGTRTQTYNVFLGAPSLPAVSAANQALFVFDPACNCMKVSENAGTFWPLKQSGGAGAPTSGDCDTASEMGRLSIDTTNHRLYVCEGAIGWKYATLN